MVCPFVVVLCPFVVVLCCGVVSFVGFLEKCRYVSSLRLWHSDGVMLKYCHVVVSSCGCVVRWLCCHVVVLSCGCIVLSCVEWQFFE